MDKAGAKPKFSCSLLQRPVLKTQVLYLIYNITVISAVQQSDSYMDLSWATAMEVPSPDHWTTRELPGLFFIRHRGYEKSVNHLRQTRPSKNQGGRQKSETAPENPAPWRTQLWGLQL